MTMVEALWTIGGSTFLLALATLVHLLNKRDAARTPTPAAEEE